MTSFWLSALFIAGVLLAWRDGMRAREIATRASRTACRACDVQLLDETVALVRLRLRRDPAGSLCVWRLYEFEYSADGARRLTGTVVIAGEHVDRVDLGEQAGTTIH